MKLQGFPLLVLVGLSVACQPATTLVVPTATSVPTAQPTYTATPPTVTATSTLEPLATPCPPQPTPEAIQLIEQSSVQSPDGVWTLTMARTGPVLDTCSPSGESQYQKVTLSNGRDEWLLIGEWEVYALGSGSYAPIYWSEDGERLYFTYAAVPDGCQGFGANIGLWQANLLTGETTQILDSAGILLSISSDETQAIYRPYGKSELVVFNFVTQTETPLTLPHDIIGHSEYTIGQALWAPDGNGVLVNIWFNFCSPPFAPEKTALVYVPFATGQAEIVLEDQTQGFIAQAWPELDKVQVHDKTGAERWLNPQTGLLSKP